MATMVKKKQKLHRTLPRKLSDLMVLALEDLSRAEKSKRFDVQMNTWACCDDNVCTVCFAGSVMVNVPAVRKSPSLPWVPSMLPQPGKYYALNCVRGGSVSQALAELKGVSQRRLDAYLGKYPCYEGVVSYHEDRKQWKKDMRRIIKQLREFGL